MRLVSSFWLTLGSWIVLFLGHLGWSCSGEGEWWSAPLKELLPLALYMGWYPFLPLSMQLGILLFSLLISNPCLPSALTRNKALVRPLDSMPPHCWVIHCWCPCIGLLGRASTPISTSASERPTVAMGFFPPRDTVNSFTALERNVVPKHNLILPAIPTYPLVPLFPWGNLGNQEPWNHRFLFVATLSLWQGESEMRILDFQERAKRHSSTLLRPMSSFELSQSRLGTIIPESHFPQHQNICAYMICHSKCQASRRRVISFLSILSPDLPKSMQIVRTIQLGSYVSWAVLKYQILHSSTLLMQRIYYAHKFPWEG